MVLYLAVCVAIAAITAVTPGCARKSGQQRVRLPKKLRVPEYLVGTVGQHVGITGLRPIPVEGYGLVVGLDGTGTTVLPPGLRREMLRMMARRKVPNAANILKSPSTAVVSIRGFVPPGVSAGERFD
ncbi:MAG: flagellar basal body P-ring protein FlgI, partial [Phycisphaerae bacterium]|nr:flagellar basal body P-ring protein FlgI [Phycisphaerae bacterium]